VVNCGPETNASVGQGRIVRRSWVKVEASEACDQCGQRLARSCALSLGERSSVARPLFCPAGRALPSPLKRLSLPSGTPIRDRPAQSGRQVGVALFCSPGLSPDQT
jgi:hypothetical protein